MKKYKVQSPINSKNYIHFNNVIISPVKLGVKYFEEIKEAEVFAYKVNGKIETLKLI